MPADQRTTRPIDGFPHYRADDLGRIQTLYAPKGGLPGDQGRILATWREVRPRLVRGVLTVNLRLGDRRIARAVHRIVLESFVGPRPQGLEARHANGHAQDCRLRNLRWDVPTRAKAWHRPNELTDHGVGEMRARYLAGESLDSVADAFNVSRSLVSQVVRRLVRVAG